tara:strand:+ start:361 stop:918 length:558 start_codon:yes stop_codon:yes gene_type:complete
MARKVLNKPSGGLTAAIKSVATTKTSRMTISTTDDQWYTGHGYNATISRQENDSRILVQAPWRYTGGTSSYFAGMGIRTIWPNGTGDNTHGWGYFWEHNTSDGNEGLFSCMKGLYNGHGLTNTAGNFEFRIGRNTANTDHSRPGNVWTSSRTDDARGNADQAAYFTFTEVSDNRMSWNNNSGGHT